MAFVHHEKRLGKRSLKPYVRLTYRNYNIKDKKVTYRIFSFPNEILDKMKVQPNDYVNMYVDDKITDLFLFKKSDDGKGYKVSNRKYRFGRGNQYVYMIVPCRKDSFKYIPHEFTSEGLVLYGNKSI